jgi:hypothetical protein
MLATCGADGFLKIYDLRTGDPSKPIQGFRVSRCGIQYEYIVLEDIYA